MTRIGVFGGTFDPVHNGHLETARLTLESFRFDRVLLVPAGRPPHKLGDPVTPFVHRFAMLALATEELDRILVSDLELSRPGPTYTVDTLRAIADRLPGAELHFLMGSDSFVQITTWRDWEALVELAHLVVLRREGSWGEAMLAKVPAALRARLVEVRPGEPFPDPPERCIYLFDNPPVPVSATRLRERLRAGETVSGLAPDAVARYAVKYGLYRPGACNDAP